MRRGEKGMRIVLLILLGLLLPLAAAAQEGPYFITYTHHMEEPGSLEISLEPVFGLPRTARGFTASLVELEYGVKGWWTTEFYVEGQSTRGDSTLFTGYRWENRFRPLLREHWINPVLYFEYEGLNGADKTLKEVVGFDTERDAAVRNGDARREKKHEIETKLILSSNFRGWNVSENFIIEKNLAHAPWEFGYALGASRPLALAASARECSFCRENFRAGIEMYGGLGEAHRFTLSGTSHYLAPLLAWDLPNGTTLRISPAFGVTGASHRMLLRAGISVEVPGFGRRIRKLIR
jgi:hypothetical protein